MPIYLVIMPDKEMSSAFCGYIEIFPSGKNFVSIEFYGNQPIKAGTPMGGGEKFLKVKLWVPRGQGWIDREWA